jgi:quercetin dioxygenase-like cupin family protein
MRIEQLISAGRVTEEEGVHTVRYFALYSLACLLFGEAAAQAVHGGVCRPVSERDQEVGCWILSNDPIGELAGNQVFWHLDSFTTREAAEAAKGKRSTVLQALGKVWLLTIDDADWHASGGQHISTIGPLPIIPGAFAAQYMEAVFTPGMTAPTHTHSGPEAWYTVAGETCLETPDGIQIGQAGGPPVIVPGGPPMHLTATGTEIRRALVLILHDANKPATTSHHDWKPKGLCKK